MYNLTFALATKINSVNEHVVLLTSLVMNTTFVGKTGSYFVADFGNNNRNNLLSLLHTTYADLSFAYKAIKDYRPFARTLYDDTTHLYQRYVDFIEWFSDIVIKDDTPQGTATTAIRGLLALIRDSLSDIRTFVVSDFM